MIWQLNDSKQRRGGWLLKKKKEAADGTWNYDPFRLSLFLLKLKIEIKNIVTK